MPPIYSITRRTPWKWKSRNGNLGMEIQRTLTCDLTLGKQAPLPLGHGRIPHLSETAITKFLSFQIKSLQILPPASFSQRAIYTAAVLEDGLLLKELVNLLHKMWAASLAQQSNVLHTDCLTCLTTAQGGDCLYMTEQSKVLHTQTAHLVSPLHKAWGCLFGWAV